MEGNPSTDHSAVANSVHDPTNINNILRYTSLPPPSDHSVKAEDSAEEDIPGSPANGQDRTYVDDGKESASEDTKPAKKRKGKDKEGTPGPVPKRAKTEGVADERSPRAGRKKGGAWDGISAAIEKTQEVQLEVEQGRAKARAERERLRYETSVKTVEMKREIKQMELEGKREAMRMELEERREIRLAEAAEREKQRQHELALARINAGLGNEQK